MSAVSDKKITDFISYLDDDGSHKSVYVDIIEINPSYVTFKTYSNNTLTIPMARVLKIKIKDDSECHNEK